VAGPLLIAEPPLQALPTLARTIGLNEALVLQQVHYRLRHARHERDGRRWVYNTYEQWQEEFPFWSVRTLKRIFHALEERGLLLTATYNRSPLDRTKWYAVRYEHPLLAGAAPSSATGRPECNPGTIAACNTDTMASCEAGPLAGQDRHDRGATLARSNHETPAETPARSATENREGEQQRAAPAAGDAPTPVVVAPIDLLVRRGVTPVAAARLAGSVAAATIERQVAIYDWLREQAPDDARLTPGRLRRMIEEDWAPPPGFVPPAERARQAALAAAAAEEGRRARAAAARRHEAAVADEAALLASLGLAAEDQAVWRALAEQPPRLPAVFGRALFYAPRGATPPALLFRERADAALAASPAYAPHRVEVERRLCDRFPRYARARVTAGRPAYLACDDVLAALRASTAPGDDA
ncbi:MAG TPA: hypothetical protein VFL91_09245, partial [Thermomicrobiales bacterium]|nr:hypothetical protein [Thermomicrobiales bacterium]